MSVTSVFLMLTFDERSGADAIPSSPGTQITGVRVR